MYEGSFQESDKYVRPPHDPPLPNHDPSKQLEDKLVDYVLSNAKPNDAEDVVRKVDDFCASNWMMHLGPEKGNIIRTEALEKYKPKKIFELGLYCGYSATFFATCLPEAEVHSIEISEEFASYGRKVIQHAGVENRVHVHIGTVETLEEVIKKEGPFDMIFIDHDKLMYLPDFKLLESYGVIVKDCVVVSDNMLRSGTDQHLEHFKASKEYQSVLFNSRLEYTDEIDAVLVSKKL